jgi:hypothetical protein
MNLSRSVINCLIFLILSHPLSAMPQVFSPVHDGQGQIQGWLNVDGVNYKLLTEEEFRKTLKDLGTYKLTLEEVDALKLKLELKDEIIVSKQNIIELQAVEVKTLREIEKLYTNKNAPTWYGQDWFKIGGTFLITSLAYGYWSLMNNSSGF